MKRDVDLMREIILWLEETATPHSPRQFEKDSRYKELPWSQDGIDYAYWSYQVQLLEEAGYVCANIKRDSVIVSGLTYLGHDYLDTVRDDEIWRNTKSAASSAGGFTFEILGDIAKGFIKTKIKQHTGVEV